MASKLTSYDNATVGLGSIVNEVGLTYNSFGQLVTDAQSHSGAVVPGTTPAVQYAYANGSANMIRPTTLTYPNGRAITISYGTSGGINDAASRGMLSFKVRPHLWVTVWPIIQSALVGLVLLLTS